MKKRIFSILLALCMVLTFMPTVAFADGESTTTSAPTGTPLTKDNISSNMTLSSGSYYLSEDITISSSLTISGTVTLDLYGHVLKMTGSGSVIKIEGSGNLTLEDSNSDNKHTDTTLPDGGVITGGTGTQKEGVVYGGGVYNEGTFTMNEGTIAACKANYDSKKGVNSGGGGVFIDTGGKFTMNDGSIENCNAFTGGGVYVWQGDSKFTMNGGSIENCTAETAGGIYVLSASEFTMTGGEIKNCHLTDSSTFNGDIYVCGNMYANGGKISDSVYIEYVGRICSTVSPENQTIFDGEVKNVGEIAAGIFKGTVKNGFSSGSHSSYEGTISGGTFNGSVENYADDDMVSEITGGKFTATVTNAKNAVVSGGDFSSATLSGDGKIGKVSFDLNEGSGDAPTQWRYNSTATEPETAPARNEYTFDGWYNGDEEWNFSTAVISDITLTAEFTPIVYNITYNLDGGTASNPASYTIESDITLSNPTKSGYTFTGWSGTGLTGEDNKTVTIAKGSTGERTYTAHWQKKSSSNTSYVQKPTLSFGDATDVNVETAADGSTVYTTAEGKLVLSKDGTTASVIPNDGYEVANVSVNGTDKGAVTTLTGLKTGDKIIVTFKQTAEAQSKAEIAQIKSLLGKMSLTARSSKTAKGNIKIVFKPDTKTQNYIQEMKDMGYTVKYRFYRSTKKSAGYKAMITKAGKTYTNTNGKAGTRYYYKVQVRAYDENGKCVAKTALKQCKYATRIFG